jgi:CubicO group peptidase (beta-lactamase class C family)
MPKTLAAALLVSTVVLTLRNAGEQTPAAPVDDFVASVMATQHIPALAFAAIRDGRVIQSGVSGLANVELNAPATDATEFAIASMSKSVAASAIMLLVQDGTLKLDDPVRRYLPEAPSTWDAMTVGQLLSHTAGVKDHFSDFPKYPKLTLDRHMSYSTQEYLKAHLDAPLNFTPGAEFAYSGGGYVVLGAIIEKITGHPYGDLVRDRIFRPLGMSHTHVISLADIIPNRATGYWFRDGRLRNADFTGQAHLGGPDVNVLTTATDMAKWVIAVSSDGPWTQASRKAMWTPARLNDGSEGVSYPAGIGYGLGWFVGWLRGHPMVGHTGALATGFTSAFFVIPDKRLSIVVLTNQWNANPVGIAITMLGRFDAEFRAVSDMQPETDRDPAETDRARQFIVGVLRGSDVTTLTTPGLARYLAAMPHPPPQGRPPDPTVTFVARSNPPRAFDMFGSPVAHVAFYKLQGDGDRSLTLLLTADGRIAGYEVY